jgi:IS5 family transposase
MRENLTQQRPLVSSVIQHPHAAELDRMSELLTKVSGGARRVAADLQRGVVNPDLGRRGLSGEQVLRIVVLKQLTGFSYDRLAFHLEDSLTYRRFCVLGIDGWSPKASTLQGNVKRVRPETLEWIHRRLVKHAQALGVEDGGTILVDSTGVESNIHHPTDSSLLNDGVRVLTRLLKRSTQFVDVTFSDHTRRAKRRALGVLNAKKDKQRTERYGDLLKVAAKTAGYAREAIMALGRLRRPEALGLRAELQSALELFSRIIDQTQRRIFEGQNVPAGEKVVSMFEPHTDILLKGGRDTVYGHKIFLTTGRSGLVLDLTVEEGNPADASRTVPLIKRHKRSFAAVPEQATFDAGFASAANQTELMSLGVQDVAFAKNSAIDVLRSVASAATHRALQRLRAGVEATISWLKRSFGLARCTWSGFRSFRAYAWGSVLAANLLQLARLTMRAG